MDSDSDIDLGLTPEEEEQLLLQLASQFPSPPIAALAVDSIPGTIDGPSSDPVQRVHPLNPPDAAGVASGGAPYRPAIVPESSVLSLPLLSEKEVIYPNLGNALSRVDADSALSADQPASKRAEDERSPADQAVDQDDGRSPIQRFRTYPRRPLTVSDLTSGAWCELQYWYTLTRLPGGRKTRTAAMRQGSKVHQQLEDEVHTTVPIDIMTRVDGFGLKLWNLVQGFRTLRETGLTRELEVWGLVDGQLVNGVIDGLTHQNPNPDFEDELAEKASQEDHRQSKLADFFPVTKQKEASHARPRIYLSDTKTRGSTKPVSAALLRPSKVQLLLYHRLLSDMAAGKLDFFRVLRRYGLDPDEAFSDTFLAQMASLHDEVFVDAPMAIESAPGETVANETKDDRPRSSMSSEPDLLRYRSLRELLSLVEVETALTFPDAENSLGHILRLQYVHRADGRELDVHDFPVSKSALDEYLDKYMSWWRGERQAKGVDIEEAFKCQICEFASDCSWRQGFDDERLRRARDKLRGPRRAASVTS